MRFKKGDIVVCIEGRAGFRGVIDGLIKNKIYIVDHPSQKSENVGLRGVNGTYYSHRFRIVKDLSKVERLFYSHD